MGQAEGTHGRNIEMRQSKKEDRGADIVTKAILAKTL